MVDASYTAFGLEVMMAVTGTNDIMKHLHILLKTKHAI